MIIFVLGNVREGLPEDILWGSFMNARRTNPKGRLRGGLKTAGSQSFFPASVGIQNDKPKPEKRFGKVPSNSFYYLDRLN